jgi:aldose 1-epimerase
MTLTERPVTRLPDGEVVEYRVASSAGAELRLMSYGATLTGLRVPGRGGELRAVTLGYPTALELISSGNTPYFGATVGRFANRIREGRFVLDGRKYHLAVNDGAVHHLHGGARGFDKRIWRGEPVREEGRAGVRFTYRSPDGEEGYPGDLDVTAEYLLAEDATLSMTYEASAGAPTILNLTNHAYWNLGSSPTVLESTLHLGAARYLDVDATLMPTGRIADVAGTPFDFRSPHRIGERISETAGGYDHCYVLDPPASPGALARAALFHDAGTGIAMEVWTTQPGIQVYSGNFLELAGFRLHGALCLETQHYPDCPNQPGFPSPVLRPGERYRHTTIHRFAVR